jgi:hypothetical protein
MVNARQGPNNNQN